MIYRYNKWQCGAFLNIPTKILKSYADVVAWFESCAFVNYTAVKDIKMARNFQKSSGKWLSKLKGAKETESTSFQQKPLVYPHEITQFIRKDKRITLV